MDAVASWGRALIEDPARIAGVAAVGVDETKFLAAKRREATQWVSAICDVARRRVVDVIEGRQGPELDAWLTARPADWKAGVRVTVTDLHEPFRARSPSTCPRRQRWPMRSTSSRSALGSSTAHDVGCSKRPSVTGATRTTRSTGAASC
jgi:hypothetical protein